MIGCRINGIAKTIGTSHACDDAQLHPVCLEEETICRAEQGAHVVTRERFGHPRLGNRNGNAEGPVARLADDGGQRRDIANDEAALSSALALLLPAEEPFGEQLRDRLGAIHLH